MPEAESASVKGGHLKTVVPVVPDAPIGHFRLNLFGGKKGYLVNTRDLCASGSQTTGRIHGPEREKADPAGEHEDRLRGRQERQAQGPQGPSLMAKTPWSGGGARIPPGF